MIARIQVDTVNSFDLRDHLAAQIRKGAGIPAGAWNSEMKRAAEHLIREGLIDLYALDTASKAPLQTSARSRKKTTTTEEEA